MTNTPDAIPEDVMKAARGFSAEAMMSAFAGRLKEPVREAIARAILAERERCARVIELHDIATSTATGEDALVPRRYASNTGMAYADAIRKGVQT